MLRFYLDHLCHGEFYTARKPYLQRDVYFFIYTYKFVNGDKKTLEKVAL